MHRLHQQGRDRRDRQSDTQTVTVCVGKDLTVSKTATASRSALYKWLINKVGDS